MRKSILKNPCSVRFRRWTRKSYAVFSGLNKVISIGHISAGISDKALIKNNLLTQISAVSFLVNVGPDAEKEDEEKEADSSITRFLFLENALPIATDYPAGCSLTYLLTFGWKRVSCSFPTFLFLKR